MPERWNSARWNKNEDGTYTKRYVQLDANGVVVDANATGVDANVATVDADGDVRITDAAAELAEELGVDPATIEGSGVEGRITKSDVEEAAATK